MSLILLCYMAILLVGTTSGVAAEDHPSTAELDDRLHQIDAELQQLSRYSLRTSVGSIGCRTRTHITPAQTEWFHIDWQEPTAIDLIVIVPTIIQDAREGLQADGFPEKFRILAGTGKTDKGTEIAAFTKEDGLLPRIAPLLIPCATTASWIRVESSVLTPLAFNGRYCMELSEIMVFHDDKNVALHQSVEVSPGQEFIRPARDKDYLVDGFTPYQMHAGRGTPSRAFLGVVANTHPHVLTVDLEDTYKIDRMNLHAIETGDNFPQSHPADMGIPRHLVVEGANRADFTDALTLVDDRIETMFDSGPINAWNFPETVCRYIRITAIEPYLYKFKGTSLFMTGFAEIEFFSGRDNVALHKTFTGNIQKHGDRAFNALTDGRNIYGMTLPVRQWMEELALRHNMEKERPLVEAELARHYSKQKTALRHMTWIAFLLAVSVVITWLIDHILHLRQVARLKERFAADLHDEIGANLHTISLLGDMIKKKGNNLPEWVTDIIERIRAVTNRSVLAVQHVSDLQTDTGLYRGLIADMKRSAERIVVELKHDFSVEGNDILERTNPRKQVDLFLFYKECLINSCRHSGATELSTRLVADTRQIRLTVSDNGSGLPDATSRDLPASLKRRAKMLRARATISQSAGGGSCITITMRTGKLSLMAKRPD